MLLVENYRISCVKSPFWAFCLMLELRYIPEHCRLVFQYGQRAGGFGTAACYDA